MSDGTATDTPSQHSTLTIGDQVRWRGSDGWLRLARGSWLPGERTGLAARVRRVLAADPRCVVAGGLPFDAGAPAVLAVGRPESTAPALPRAAESMDAVRTGASPRPAGYRERVVSALEWIGATPLRKVVLSRTVELATAGVDPDRMLAALAAVQHRVWLYDLRPPGQPRFLGASPELLVRRRGDRVESVPLAGSAPAGTSAAGLLGSAKNRHEHQVVVTAIADVLNPWCHTLHVPSEPTSIAAGGIWHLATPIVGTLLPDAPSSLEMAHALSPTPALGGRPRAEAVALISQLEPEARGLYGGAIGWCDERGDGEWAVAIRGAEVAGDRVRLRAGAGIVTGSDPDEELAETSLKLATIAAALGLRVLR